MAVNARTEKFQHIEVFDKAKQSDYHIKFSMQF